MTDKNLIDLTNEDIISSLEVIATTRNCNDCKIRNCKWGACNCEQITANAALDLIKRQQAEIERLQKKVEELSEVLSDSIRIRYKEAKSEAVKEFAERLKNEIISDTAYGCDSNQHSGYYDYTIKIGDIPEYIDNLVKEMVGDK